MKKILITVCIFLLTFACAKTDFSEMSTQELISIMGYVKVNEKSSFNKELKSRISTMNSNEKKEYKKNLRRLKK